MIDVDKPSISVEQEEADGWRWRMTGIDGQLVGKGERTHAKELDAWREAEAMRLAVECMPRGVVEGLFDRPEEEHWERAFAEATESR